MKTIHSTSIALILATAGLAVVDVVAAAQAPGAGAGPAPAAQGAPAARGGGGGGGGRGGRGGLPGATPAQTQAVADMNTALAPLNAAVNAARMELATATFADVKSVPAITAAVEKLRAAELTLATRRAEEFAKLQAGPNKLNAEQVAALIAAGGNPAAGGRGGRGGGGGGGGRGAPPPGGAGPAGPGRGN
jgi:hypothetical protein